MEEFSPTLTSMKVHYACVQFYWTCYVKFDVEKSRGNKLSSSQFYVALKWSSSCQRFSFLLLKLLINFWLKIRKIKRSVNQKDLALIKSKRKKKTSFPNSALFIHWKSSYATDRWISSISFRIRYISRGGSRIFFRRGCTRLLLYFNTSKPHSFLGGRTPVVLENRRSSPWYFSLSL